MEKKVDYTEQDAVMELSEAFKLLHIDNLP